MSKVEILPIEAMRALPECGRNDAGVYFLWRNDELLYIGRSKNVHNRLVRHRGIPFTRHTFLSIDYEMEGWRHGSVESAYIAHYSPPFNVMNTAAWNAARKWA